MASFPTATLPGESVKSRFQEKGFPRALNQRWLGMPRGVYLGFTPEVTTGSSILTLAVDTNSGFSLLKVGAPTSTVMVDIFTAEPVVLNFTDHTVWPVYVIGRADFVDGRPTQGRILTRATTAAGPQEVLICKIDKPLSDLVVTSVSPVTRQPPVAFQGQQVGFMPDGAIGDLADASASVVEVQDARTSLYTGAHADLKTRIDEDLIGAALADRLALRHICVVSNTHSGVVGASANVSGSFIETQRAVEPIMTLQAGGDESVEGVICGPTDTTRNVCSIVDATTGLRVIDAATSHPVFGRLSFQSGTVGGGKQIRFFNAVTTIDGNGTNPFQAPLQEGDVVLAPDGLYYEIAEFLSTDIATLGSAYRGAGAPVVGIDSAFRRFTLDFHTVAGATTIPSALSIQFLFSAFFRADRSIFDAFLLHQKNASRPPLPDATVTVGGKALLATNGGRVGSLRTIESNGVPVANDAHTLNFAFGGAADAGGGVANVSVPGAPGPPGPDASQGPAGPTGAAGAGYSLNNSFELSPISGQTAVVFGIVTLSFTVDFTDPGVTPTLSDPPGIVHLNGGWATIDGPHGGGDERLVIDSITKLNAQEGRIVARIIPEAAQSLTRIRLFLGASQ